MPQTISGPYFFSEVGQSSVGGEDEGKGYRFCSYRVASGMKPTHVEICINKNIEEDGSKQLTFVHIVVSYSSSEDSDISGYVVDIPILK